MIFVIPTSGVLTQYFPNDPLIAKVGEDILLTFQFVTDDTLTVPWNLNGAAVQFFAKKYLDSTCLTIAKYPGDPGWDFTNAVNGILNLQINGSDLTEESSLWCEITFTLSGQVKVYKTVSFVLEVMKGVFMPPIPSSSSSSSSSS